MDTNKKEDFLDVDKQIPGQMFTCLSFLSPDDMIEKKNLYVMEQFRKYYFSYFEQNVDCILQTLNENRLQPDEQRKMLFDKIKMFKEESMEEVFESFNMNERQKHEEIFDKENNNRTSVRGVKVRGTYSTYAEAQDRAKKLQKKDPYFNVFVGQVGYWLPWDPKNVENEEFAEEKLNELMKEYKKNLDNKNEIWERVTKERIQNAIREGQQNSQSQSNSNGQNELL